MKMMVSAIQGVCISSQGSPGQCCQWIVYSCPV